MVGIDGYTFALQVRASHPTMRMLHVTGNPHAQDRFLALGVPTFRKPFEPEALLQQVKRLLA